MITGNIEGNLINRFNNGANSFSFLIMPDRSFPMASLFLRKDINSTVTVCHSATNDIKSFTLNADIVIAAIGKPDFVKGDMIKEGAVIIDVGINRVEDKNSAKGYKLTGDVDFNSCIEKVSGITPVPGGVGPMTIAMLMRNTLDSASKIIYSRNLKHSQKFLYIPTQNILII